MVKLTTAGGITSANCNLSLYLGASMSTDDMCYITRAQAQEAIKKDASTQATPQTTDRFVRWNTEQVFLLGNIWIKFVRDLGYVTFGDYVLNSILHDGFISTIAACSKFADTLIANRAIPVSLEGYFGLDPDDIGAIKGALQALRFPKRFSPGFADITRDSALDAFVSNDKTAFAQHTVRTNVRFSKLYVYRHTVSYDWEDWYEDDVSLCTEELRYGSVIDDDRITYTDSGVRFGHVTKLQSEYLDCIKDLFSYERADGSSVYLDDSLFPWTDDDLEHAAISEAIPSGAALNSCKSRVCKLLNAQVSDGRPYGDERCVPPSIIAGHKVYQLVKREVVTAPMYRDVVVVNAVPKTYKSPRIIAPETVSNSIKAWMIERWLRRMIKMSKFRHCLLIKIDDTAKDGATYANVQHKRAADYKHWATFDYTSASDQVLKIECQACYPDWLWNIVRKGVAGHYTLNTSKLWVLNMVSTMGNPNTFRNMEVFIGGLCLLSIRLYNRWKAKGKRNVPETAWSVYGDDVCIDIRVAETFIDVCKAFGMTLNLTKSHWEKDDPYREACGREYWLGQDITSIYWPRRNLHPEMRAQKLSSYDLTDESFWASIVALNNHLVVLSESKYNEKQIPAESAAFMQAYLRESKSDISFTHPRAPWRKDGILLGYEPRVRVVMRDCDINMLRDKYANANWREYPCDTADAPWYVSEVSFFDALDMYSDPHARFVATTVATVGYEEPDVKSVKIRSRQGTSDYLTCACAAISTDRLDLFEQSVLYKEYLAHGPEPLGTSQYEAGLSIRRKFSKKVTIVGLANDVI